jgi:hypothetical protein
MRHGEDVAGQLERALAEQARLGEAYQRAVGTSAEFSSYVKLRAAGVRVARCDRRARARIDDAGLPPQPA